MEANVTSYLKLVEATYRALSKRQVSSREFGTTVFALGHSSTSHSFLFNLVAACHLLITFANSLQYLN